MRIKRGAKLTVYTGILLVFSVILIMSQGVFGYQEDNTFISSEPQFNDLTNTFGYPSATFEWDLNYNEHHSNTLVVRHVSPVTFTGLSVGWALPPASFNAEEFEIHVRTKETSGCYNEWNILHGEYEPENNPSGLFWSELYLTPDGDAHSEFGIKLVTPDDSDISRLKVSTADTSFTEDKIFLQADESFLHNIESDLMPNIIKRDGWWGNLPEKQINSPDWEPEKISPSHVIIHHTATQNNPSNPAQAVRNIWHYHAITLGWGDIGYNFLIDQHGNIYQGRNNPWLDTVDTRAAHAGLSNSKSFGVSLLGQFESSVSSPSPGLPTQDAIDSLEQLIAWRFNQYNLNSYDTATIETRRYGFIDVPRICGHRDVAATACPGNTLYDKLPSIKANVDKILKDNNNSVFRLFGINRYQTAVEISNAGWTTVTKHIILARGDDYADALAGVPLAYRLNAPILLTSNHRLDHATTNEIQRLQAEQVIILGGVNAIPEEIKTQLEDLGVNVKRIAGGDRYETAVKIAEEMANNGAKFDTGFISVGNDFADALSTSSYAARMGAPILMTRTETLHESVSKALVNLEINNTIVVGGQAAVSEEVFNKLPNAVRINGDNRYATSTALAEVFLPEDKNEIFMATGLDFPDAIAGAVLAAKENSGVLLVRGDLCEPNHVVQSFLKNNGIKRTIILGGNASVSCNIENWLKVNLCQ